MRTEYTQKCEFFYGLPDDKQGIYLEFAGLFVHFCQECTPGKNKTIQIAEMSKYSKNRVDNE